MTMDRTTNHPVLDFSKGREVSFTFEGRRLTGYEGESVAAALHAAGIRALHESTKKHRPRGLFCAIGNCSSCLMKVNGVPNVRVCIEPLREGMTVEDLLTKFREGAGKALTNDRILLSTVE